jgi:thiamine biosynthesis lipoprotein
MGTSYTIGVPRLPQGVQRASLEAAIAEVLAEADQHLSGWNPASELVQFNSAVRTEWQPVTPTLYAAAEQAVALSQATDGAFDVTVGPLVRAWGFGAGAEDGARAPTAASIEQLLREVGYTKLELRNDPPALRKTVPGLSIDLDGIAPGWAVDRVAQRFEALGIHDYLVELGGEIRARGLSAEGRRWRIAVETPTAGERRAFAVIEVDGVGVSTSGDYRDYREVDGQRISHTIDPRTGRPVAHALASVTVVHESAAEADAWATALMVLGPEAGMAMARQRSLAALFIVRGATSGTFIETSTPEFARLRLPQAAGL